MKHLTEKLTIFSLCVMTILGCESSNDDSPTTPAGNHAPIIQSVTASPSTISSSRWARVSCVATDADGDSLTYVWNSPSGFFDNGNTGQSVVWDSGNASDGSHYIMVIASDGVDIARDSVLVQIQ
jgi:hypothetical protein